MYYAEVNDFKEWRSKARDSLSRHVPPHVIQWNNQGDTQAALFNSALPMPEVKGEALTVPRDFLSLAERIACHSEPQRWAMLYQTLWRICFEQKNLLKIASDPLVHQLHMMNKAIGRDAHKTKAFVRFRECIDENDETHYVAWHNPDYNVLRLVAPFFSRRFDVMKWAIMTPFETASWDGEKLHYSPGLPRDAAPDEDKLEDMWKTYYKSTFNPARIKIKMMKQEMPVRHWKTLPEASLIPGMLKEAESRVAKMLYEESLNPALKLFKKCGNYYTKR